MVDQEKACINGKEVNITRLQGIATIENPLLTKKLFTRAELAALSDIWHQHGIKIAFATGVYDMIHNGHMRFLQLAASLGDVLVVGLNSDQSVRNLKGPTRPILNQNIRAEALANLGYVNFISIYDEPSGDELIKAIKPDRYLCVEGSWKEKIAEKDEVIAMSEHGGEVFWTPRQHPLISTTNILEQISAAAVEEFKAQISTENGK